MVSCAVMVTTSAAGQQTPAAAAAGFGRACRGAQRASPRREKGPYTVVVDDDGRSVATAARPNYNGWIVLPAPSQRSGSGLRAANEARGKYVADDRAYGANAAYW